jgi:hypothetical protein
MPANFAEVWLNRVRQNLTTLDVAPWLDGIPELDTNVLEVGSGDASELNVIHIPRTSFNPDVLINNTAYPIAIQSYTDDETLVSLDKYQTKATSISDDKIIGASYAVIDPATKSHTVAINAKKYTKAAHAISPASNTATTPVIAATGAPRIVGGPASLIYEDMVNLKDALDAAGCPKKDRRLVLSTAHWNDLLVDRKNFGDKLINYNTGMPAPFIAGFELFEGEGNALYTSAGVKKAYGAVKAAGDRQGSFAFWKGQIAKKTGMTKQYFKEAKGDPEAQANLLNYRHYFIAMPFDLQSLGAIY